MARIAIDLTPVLPGGTNGGAKIAVLNLIQNLKFLAPRHAFILLTTTRSHNELAALDGANVKRVCVDGPEDVLTSSHTFRLRTFLSKLLLLGASKVQPRIEKPAFCLQKLARLCAPHTGLLRHLDIDLLFCPFTDPKFAEDNTPVISIIYDLQHVDYPQFFSVEERQGREIFFRDTVNKADSLICISETTRRTLLKHFNLDENKAKTIHIAVQSRLNKVPENQVKQLIEDLDLKERQYMFYPANFWPHKNHRMLLTAYRMFLSAHPDTSLELLFTGDLKKEESELKCAVRRMGMDDKVHFMGYLSDIELAAVWQGCKFLIFPSLYEGFGIPVVEAMSFGKPVLCSNATSLPEVAGDAALFFDPRNPQEIVRGIETIMDNPEIVISLIKKGWRRMVCFREEKMARQYLAEIDALLARGKEYKNSIFGLYQDGWTESEFRVCFGSDPKKRTLKITASLPAYVPVKEMKIKQHASLFSSRIWHFRPGDKITIETPLPQSHGSLHFVVEHPFVPSEFSDSKDHRRLGVRWEKCVILTDQQEEELPAQ